MNAQVLCKAAVARSPRPVQRLRYWRATVDLATGVAVGAIGGVAAVHHSLSVPTEMLPMVAEINVEGVGLTLETSDDSSFVVFTAIPRNAPWQSI